VAPDGILNLDKPRGETSFGVVAKVRRISGEQRVGHAGTLDPDATGVLVMCLGQATRLVEYLADTRKLYRAEVEFGVATDTYDASGRVVSTSDTSHLDRQTVEDAVRSFVGAIEQLPPAFSALKHQGVPLYRLARAGVQVPRKARQVEVFNIELQGCRLPTVVLEVECGKGFYIRSLAHDLGESLGCGAHLKSLVRLRSGPFDISDSVGIEELSAAGSEKWRAFLRPPDLAVQHLPRVTLDASSEQAVLDGRPVEELSATERSLGLCRAYNASGELIAIMAYDEERERWQPRKVLARRPPQS
jgi:tRNA pseudouridine55 synthase